MFSRSKLYGTVKFLGWYKNKAGKRCWRQALSFLSDNLRHSHEQHQHHHQGDARDAQQGSFLACNVQGMIV